MVQPGDDNNFSGMNYAQMDQNINLFGDALNDMAKQAARVQTEKDRINTGFYGDAGTAYQGALQKWQEGYDSLVKDLQFMHGAVEGGKQLTVRSESNSHSIVQGLTNSI